MNDRLAKAERELVEMNNDVDEEDKSSQQDGRQPPNPIPSRSPINMQRQQINTNPNNAELPSRNALEVGSSDPPNNSDARMPGDANEEMQDEQEDNNQAAEQQNLAPPGTGKSSVNRRSKKNQPVDPSAIASSVKRNHAARATQHDINQIAGFMQGM